MSSLNATKVRPISMLKQLMVPTGTRAVKIPLGIYRGFKLNIDFESQTQIYLGLWEFETYPYIRRALCDARWLIDVGAGFGEMCILFKRNLRRVIAIEPDEIALSRLHLNMALNGISDADIEVHPRYVGAAISAEYIRLDDLQVDRSQPGFIKIDIDGSEMDALESGATLIAEGSLQLLVEVHSLNLELSCLKYLSSRGYACEIIDNSRWRLIIPEKRPTEHNRWIWAEKQRF